MPRPTRSVLSGEGSCPLRIPGALCVSIRFNNLGSRVQPTLLVNFQSNSHNRPTGAMRPNLKFKPHHYKRLDMNKTRTNNGVGFGRRRRATTAASSREAAAAEARDCVVGLATIGRMNGQPRAGQGGAGVVSGMENPSRLAQVLEKARIVNGSYFPWGSFCFPWRSFGFPGARDFLPRATRGLPAAFQDVPKWSGLGNLDLQDLARRPPVGAAAGRARRAAAPSRGDRVPQKRWSSQRCHARARGHPVAAGTKPLARGSGSPLSRG